MAYTLTNPIAITINAVAHSCVLINQDSYGSEYLDRTTSSLYEVRIKIRHTKETAKAGQTRIDRHNIEVTQTIYGVNGAPDVVHQAYMVVRNQYNALTADVQKLCSGLVSILTTDNLTGLVGWRN